jgi:hypothetical protein
LSCSLENWTRILGRLQNTHSDKGTVISDQIAVPFCKLHQRLGNSPRVGSYLPIYMYCHQFLLMLWAGFWSSRSHHHGVAWQKNLRFYRMYADGSIGYPQMEYVASQILTHIPIVSGSIPQLFLTSDWSRFFGYFHWVNRLSRRNPDFLLISHGFLA